MTTNGDRPKRETGLTQRVPPTLALSDQEAVQQHLRPAIKIWCDKVVQGVKVGERTAMNLYARAMKIAGAEVEINTLVLQAVGADPVLARSLVEQGKLIAEMPEEERVRAAEEYLREVYVRRPELRARSPLFSGAEVQ